MLMNRSDESINKTCNSEYKMVKNTVHTSPDMVKTVDEIVQHSQSQI